MDSSSFRHTAPQLWNKLPHSLRVPCQSGSSLSSPLSSGYSPRTDYLVNESACFSSLWRCQHGSTQIKLVQLAFGCTIISLLTYLLTYFPITHPSKPSTSCFSYQRKPRPHVHAGKFLATMLKYSGTTTPYLSTNYSNSPPRNF